MGVWAYGGVWRWEGEGEGTYLSFEAVEHGSLDLGVGAELFRLARDAKSLGHLGELIRLGGMGWGRMGLYGEGRSGTERDGAGRDGMAWDGVGWGGMEMGWGGAGGLGTVLPCTGQRRRRGPLSHLQMSRHHRPPR